MDHATLRKPVSEVAAAWHDRIHRDNVSEETRSEFARWLAESPEHRTAYEETDRVWSALKGAAHDPQILALRHETALRLTRMSSKSTRAMMWRVAAVILVVLGTSLAILSFDTFHGHGDGRYVTATGERLTVTLTDGSQLTLNTQTELQVAFTRAERTVRLTRGQAVFEVAKDPSRPFVVEAHQRRFIAVGTAFDVRLDGEQINVTMIEGVVRVERTPSAVATQATSSTVAREGGAHMESPATTIIAGEQLTVDRESQDHVRPADPERVTSWRRGQVLFENTRLADAVAELNRYSDTKIELADPALADLRLSGGFATGRPTVFVEAVTAYFPIQVQRADDRAVVLSVRQ